MLGHARERPRVPTRSWGRGKVKKSTEKVKKSKEKAKKSKEKEKKSKKKVKKK